jgi:hypothetical protein
MKLPKERYLSFYVPYLLWLGFLFQNITSILRPCKIFCKKLMKLCSYSPSSMLEEHKFSAVHACLSNMFATAFLILRTYHHPQYVLIKDHEDTQRIVRTRFRPLLLRNYIATQKKKRDLWNISYTQSKCFISHWSPITVAVRHSIAL